MRKKIPPPWKLYSIFFNPNYSWDAKYIIKVVSAVFTWFLLYTPITANQVTIIMTILFVVSGYFFAMGDHTSLIIGVIILFVGWFLDGSDGEVAVWKKQFSITGKYIDYVSHGLFTGVFFALGLGQYLLTKNITLLYLGVSATFFHLMHNYTRFTFILLLKSGDIELAKLRKQDGFIKKILRYLSFGNFDFAWTVLMLIFIAFNQVPIYLYFIGLVIPVRWLIHMFLCADYGENSKKKLKQSYN